MLTAKTGLWQSKSSAPVRSFVAAMLVAVFGLAAPSSRAADGQHAPDGNKVQAEADVAAIRAAAAAYRESLAKNDAAGIRRAWCVDGDVVDGWGNLFSAADVTNAAGRPAGGPRPEMRVGETRLRLVTPDVAIEDGSVDVVVPGTTTPIEGWFSAIWVKQGRDWKLAGIREAERPPATDADALDDLDWMVGEWTLVPGKDVAKEAVPAMEMSVRWDAGRMFLVRDVRLTLPATEPVTVDVQQRIGWDPLVGRVRSWSFSTDGTRTEATWFRDGTSWIAKGTSVQPDGTQTTAVHIYSYDGKDRCQWRTMRDPFAADDRMPVRATWIRKSKEGTK